MKNKEENVQLENNTIIEEIKDVKEEANLNEESSKHHREKLYFKKRNNILIIIFISILITIITVITIYIIAIKFETNIFKNVYVLNKNVEGYSPKQLEELLLEKNKEIEDINLEIYQGSKKIYTVYSSNIDLEIDIDKTLKNAFTYGRNSNVFENALTVIKNMNNVININIEYSYDDKKLNELIKNIDLTLDDRYVNDTYTIDSINNNLILVKGTIGSTIDYDKTKNKLIEVIVTGDNKYELELIKKQPATIDLNELYEKTNINPVNAYVDESLKKVVKEINGHKLEKSKIEELLKNLKEKNSKEEIVVPLEIIKADIQSKDLNYSNFNDKLQGVTTYFNSSDKNRSNNIAVGAKYINEVVVAPGEIFSFNKTVGEITRAKGYLDATTFSGGKVVKGIGGGICQVSSTLYNVALKSNLEIVTRYAHSLPVGYVLPSLDATIYVGVQDLKFKNTREYPIKIIASYNRAGSLNISIYGVKEDTEYDITLQSKTIKTIYPKTKYVYDNTLEKGKEVVTFNGSNGVISESYIVKSLNGKVISTELLSRDTYGAQDKIIKVGTKSNEVNIY